MLCASVVLVFRITLCHVHPEDAQLLKEIIRERCEEAFKNVEPCTMSIEEEHLPVA